MNLRIQTKETVAVAENHLGCSMENLEERIKDLMAKSFLVERSKIIDEADLLNDLGADSLGVFELIINLEDEYGIEIQDKELLNFTKVGEAVTELAKLVRKHLA